MTELEFGQVISSLWASRMWSNKSTSFAQLIQENTLPVLREAFKHLLWEDSPLAGRYDTFRRMVKGLGSSSVTELLAYVHPDECTPGTTAPVKPWTCSASGGTSRRFRKSRITGQKKYEAFTSLSARSAMNYRAPGSAGWKCST